MTGNNFPCDKQTAPRYEQMIKRVGAMVRQLESDPEKHRHSLERLKSHPHTVCRALRLLEWVQTTHPRKTINQRHTTYGLKHHFREALAVDGIDDGYLTDLLFQAVLVITGFDLRSAGHKASVKRTNIGDGALKQIYKNKKVLSRPSPCCA